MQLLTEILNFFGAERYSQHSICLTNDPLMIFLYVLSDLTTFASFMTIGLCLLVNPRAATIGMSRPSMRILFGLFIFLCGLTHLTSVVTMFYGVYRLDILVRAAMGAVSAVTAIITAADLIEGDHARPVGN